MFLARRRRSARWLGHGNTTLRRQGTRKRLELAFVLAAEIAWHGGGHSRGSLLHVRALVKIAWSGRIAALATGENH